MCEGMIDADRFVARTFPVGGIVLAVELPTVPVMSAVLICNVLSLALSNDGYLFSSSGVGVPVQDGIIIENTRELLRGIIAEFSVAVIQGIEEA